jgi:deoxyadenosine/deoxycytidine kinase
MTIITIDGNIGSGKTTILNYLHTNYNIYIDLEPIEQWKPFLDDIYNNNKNYFNFQIRVWLDRSWIQEKDNTTIIMERSPYFIRNTFNKYIIDNNLINNQENNIIQELYNKTDLIWKSDYYIYIRSSPEKCLERINKRCRENEQNISIDYLNEIHKLHEDAYNNAIKNKMKIFVIDIESKSLETIAKEIINFMENISLYKKN